MPDTATAVSTRNGAMSTRWHCSVGNSGNGFPRRKSKRSKKPSTNKWSAASSVPTTRPSAEQKSSTRMFSHEQANVLPGRAERSDGDGDAPGSAGLRVRHRCRRPQAHLHEFEGTG